MAEANQTVNLTKYEFAKATMTYQGRVVGQGEVHPLQAKVKPIDMYPVPTFKKELMQFLGLVGYYHSFCGHFSTAITPMTNLFKKILHLFGLLSVKLLSLVCAS